MLELCKQYILVNSWGKESGVKKSQIHAEISKYMAKEFGLDENIFHDESRDITDNLDFIGLPKYREISQKETEILALKLEEKLIECAKRLKN